MTYSRTEKSLVAIARALAADAEVLVLDEPTASLPADEVARLFTALRRLRTSRRRHDLRLAPARRGLRDRRSHGRSFATGASSVSAPSPKPVREEVDSLDRGTRALTGIPAAGPTGRPGAARLRAGQRRGRRSAGLPVRARGGRRFRRPSRRGAGADRAGRSSGSRAAAAAGSCSTAHAIAASSPREAIGLGINLVCADRVAESIVPGLSVRENLFLNPVTAGLQPDVVHQASRRIARRASSSASASGSSPTIPHCRSSGCRAAISRKSWSVDGCS